MTLYDQEEPGKGLAEVTGSAPVGWEETTAQIPWVDDESGADSIAMQIWNASTPEEVGAELPGRSVTKLGLVGRELVLQDLALAPSEYDQKYKCYAIIDSVDANGEQITFSIGGIPMVQAVKWKTQGAFPLVVKITEIPSRKAGRNPAFRFLLVAREVASKS